MGVLHVTFGHSAAGSLKQALGLSGRDQPVRALIDDLGVGPIAGPMTAAAREPWLFGSLLDEAEAIAELDSFWAEVTAAGVELVIWMSRRSVRDLTGLLALVARCEDMPLQVVDVADVPFLGRDGRPRAATGRSFGYVRADQVFAHGLLDLARPLSSAERAAHRATWVRLQADDADLRILDDTGLVSVDITHFDPLITSFVNADWQRCARVIGDATYAASPGLYSQVSDNFIWWRLRELIDEGALEAEGDLDDLRASSVRRRVGHQ